MSIQHFLPPEWQAHEYQKRGIEWLITHPEGALFWAPGLGKTSTTLGAYCKLREYGYTYRMLVLAPLRVCQSTWVHEYKRWAQFCELKIGLAHGIDKEEILHSPNYDIVVINYDAIPWMTEQFKAKGNPFGIVVFDELTKLKHTTTKRFKVLKPWLQTFTIRWGLTGTPASNGLMDLFGQMYCLDLGYRFGKYITHFRSNYFYQKPHDEFNWYITPDKAERIHKKVADLAMYLQPEEVLQLPDILHIDLPVSLPKKALDHYKSMEAYAIAQLENSVLTAANAGVVTNKLRQIAGGAVYVDAAHNIERIHTTKLDALDDLIEEQAGEPLMVAYNFDHECEAILERHPYALAIRGGMGSMERVLTAWNTRQCPLLLVQPTAAAHGLNLQFGGSALCWFSQTYNLEEYIQLTKRLHRQGQTEVVRVYHILADKTVDHAIRKVLSTKDQTQNALFEALRHELLASSQTVT